MENVIEVIIFDLGGVILNFDPYITCRKLAKLSKQEEHEIYDFIFNSGLERLYNQGRITSFEFFDMIRRRLNLDITFYDFKPIWVDIFSLNPSIPELLSNLKKRYQIFLLSNTNEMHFEWIKDRFDILEEVIDEYILSYKVGFTKPDKRIFHEALVRCGASPKKCIYTDDIKDYVDVANELGMIGIHFQSIEKLKEELVSHGVVI